MALVTDVDSGRNATTEEVLPRRWSNFNDEGLEVFLVGRRYAHHATHSGYEGFSRYLGRQLAPPVAFRSLYFRWFPLLGWRIDQTIAKIMRRRCYSLALLLTELGAAKHLTTHRNAVYHVLYGDTGLTVLGRIGRLLRVPVVATFHEPIVAIEWLRIDRALLRTLDAVVLVSESQRAYFAGKIDNARIHVVPHGVDTEFFCPDAEPVEPQVVTVGSHFRDFETLSAAIDLVLKARPEVRFIAVGARNDHESGAFQHPRVQFVDGIDDEGLLDLYRRSQAAVFSFKESTANNSVLEAMATGVPVLCTAVGGTREYLGDAGLLCPPREPTALAESLLRVLGDRALARALGARARERASEFDYRRVADLHRAVYARVIQGRVAGPSPVRRSAA
jgi:glycosyltransferase involved in cell wall biosynthesis